MFKVIRKQIRPNTEVPFFAVTDVNFLKWMRENYLETGKILPAKNSISEDGLVQTTEVYFQSHEVAREWKYNTYVVENLHNVLDAYCAAAGIIVLPTIVIGEVENNVESV